MNDKDSAFYLASLYGWIISKIERDKSLLFLSIWGIVLLIMKCPKDSILCVISTCAFLVSSLSCVIIFEVNTKYLGSLSKNTGSSSHYEKLLRGLDILLITSFIIGTLILLLMGLDNLRK